MKIFKIMREEKDMLKLKHAIRYTYMGGGGLKDRHFLLL